MLIFFCVFGWVLVAALIVAVVIGIKYIRWILQRFNDVASGIVELLSSAKSYKEYIERIYEVDVFAGEPVVQQLIENSKIMVDELERFREQYSVFNENEEEEEEI